MRNNGDKRSTHLVPDDSSFEQALFGGDKVKDPEAQGKGYTPGLMKSTDVLPGSRDRPWMILSLIKELRFL